jgi:precorrin-6Y C5,15-methyltransferase (decarboxylating)
VGIGEDGIDGLSGAARNLIQSATVVFGGARHLALAAPLIRGVARPWATPFDSTLAEVLKLRGRAVCVLASGDPFNHGVGSILSRHVAVDETVALHPASPNVRLAASRLSDPATNHIFVLWPLPDYIGLICTPARES